VIVSRLLRLLGRTALGKRILCISRIWELGTNGATEGPPPGFRFDPKRRRIYEREALAFEASELISRLMEEQQLSKTDLARLVGTSKSHVTQLLSGSRNMTVHTLADLAFALGHKVGKFDPCRGHERTAS